MTRHVAMIINQFSPAAGIVAASDLILTVPERIARQSAGTYRLRVKDCPVQVPETFTETSVVWHQRLGEHPANRWLRQTLQTVVGSG